MLVNVSLHCCKFQFISTYFLLVNFLFVISGLVTFLSIFTYIVRFYVLAKG